MAGAQQQSSSSFPVRWTAAVLEEVRGPVVLQEVTLDELGHSDVLVRIRATGICQTDLDVVRGTLRYPLPIVLGHEAAGTVEAVGSNVTSVAPGDAVVCSWNPYCGACFYCIRNQFVLCERFVQGNLNGMLLDGRTRLSADGTAIHSLLCVSSHAEFAVVPETGAIKIPKEIPFDLASLIGCSVMTGFGAATRVARIDVGSSVAVIGCGAVGLNVIQGARISGAGTIIASDLIRERLELAAELGATHTIDASVDNCVGTIRQLTGGRGADFSFEAAGTEESLDIALDSARLGGTVVILGRLDTEAHVRIRFGSLMGDKLIVRSSYGGARPLRDFPLLARYYLSGDLRLKELVQLRISLDRIAEGYDAVRTGSVVRAVVVLP
jgi:S-(hydroxymethyl)glutathione dehydrogenase/alcohol dehydrogenase